MTHRKVTCDEAAVTLEQRPQQQEDVIRREADQEDKDGAADQLPDPGLLVRLGSRAAANRAKNAQVAHLHQEP